jgi:hypothetical protein
MQREFAAAMARVVDDVVYDQRHIVEEFDNEGRPDRLHR